jgi:hypothetical protein
MSEISRNTWDNVVVVIREGNVDATWDGKVKNLIYDVGTMAWVSQTATASSGGGGDASAANQTTEISKLTSLDGKIPSQGQALMSGSTPVVIASNQSAIPVTGAFYQATQPVSGTITANIGTSGSLALDATLTGGNSKAIVRGGAKGTTTASDVTSTSVNVNTQALDVSVKGTTTISGTVTANVGTTGGLALQSGTNSMLDKSATGTIAAVNQSVTLSTNGLSEVFISITGTWVGNLTYEIQAGDGQWVATYGSIPWSTLLGSSTVNGLVTVKVGSASQVRVRAAAWTSGTASVTLNGSVAARTMEIFQLTPGNLAMLSNGTVSTDSPSYAAGTNQAASLTTRGGVRVKVLGNDASTLIRNNYSITNVTTTAYTQLVASTASNISRMHIYDSSGQDLVLAVGSAGSEVDQIQIPQGGWNAPIDLFIPAGSRLSVKAMSATATSGLLLITGLK